MTEPTAKTLKTLVGTVAVTQFLSHRDYLGAMYDAVKQAVDSYSYLRFAADLGFGETNVIRLVIAGKRPLTSKAAERIAKALELHGPERRYWTTLVKYGNARVPAERDNLFRLLLSYKTKAQPAALDPAQSEYFGEWYHPVIRELVALADFNGDPQWIQERLVFPLRLEQIKRSLELLEKIGVIRHDPAQSRYVQTVGRIATDAEIDSLAVVRYHQKMIEIGRESITTVGEERRDVRAVTLTLPESALPLLKGKIEEFVNAVAGMEDPLAKGEHVIQVNVQMFPFTKSGPGRSRS